MAKISKFQGARIHMMVVVCRKFSGFAENSSPFVIDLLVPGTITLLFFFLFSCKGMQGSFATFLFI